MTRYTVVVSNTSQEQLDNLRVLGGGCDAGFGSMAGGTVARRSFWIRHDGVLVFRASRGADTIEHVIDPYVTNNGGGHTTVTVQRDDKIVVAHLAPHWYAGALDFQIRPETMTERAICLATSRPEQRVPADHPLRAIRTMTNGALSRLSPRFESLYASTGRPSATASDRKTSPHPVTVEEVGSVRVWLRDCDGVSVPRWSRLARRQDR
jgi:hypothetical protein